MTVKQKYGQITAEGAQRVISEFSCLDDNVTIGELKAFLTQRKQEKEAQDLRESNDLLNKLTGKCLKINFKNDHVVLLHIQELELINKYGFIDAKLIGESIVKYNGVIRHESKIDSNYSNYFPNEGCEEITLTEFDRIKSLLRNANSLL